ncbi:hypothetical protein ACGLQ1_004704, partial [Escherichia coli]
ILLLLFQNIIKLFMTNPDIRKPQQLRQAQQAQERVLAARAEAENSFVVSVNGQEVDLSKLTSARLATLCEAEELDIHKDPKETAEAFRIRVREAFRRRVAETEQHGGTE